MATNDDRGNRRVRRGYRTQAQSVITESDAAFTVVPLDRQDLQMKLDTLFRCSACIQDLDSAIWLSAETEAAADADMKESGDIQQRIRLCTIKIQDVLAALTFTTESNLVQPSEASFHTSVNHHPQRQIAKLPTLQLPKFGGNPLEWSTFWDSYESAVHRSDLSAVDKFNYLKSLLHGTAAQSIAGIAVTNTSYDTAVKLIQDRFGQPQMIINAHVESLVNLPRATNETLKLRLLFDSVEMHVRGLESLGITAEGNEGKVMTPIILTKLPEDIRLILTRKHGTAVGDLTKLRELLKTEIEARELSSASKSSPSPIVHDPTFSTGALVTQSGPQACVFCGSHNHTLFSCNTVSHPVDRKAVLEQANRCTNCLKPGHSSLRCNSALSCRQCGKRHHTSICPGSYRQSQERPGYQSSYPMNPHMNNFNRPRPNSFSHSRQTNFSPFRTNRPLPPQWRNQHQPHRGQPRRQTNTNVVSENAEYEQTNVRQLDNQATTLVTRSTSSVILMQTALAEIDDSLGTRHTIRLLFDTASQRSYVTADLYNRLQLASSESENLCVNGFGQSRGKTRRYELATLKCCSRYDNVEHKISAIVVPTITQPIYRTPISDKGHEIITSMKLADPIQHSEWIQVDVLIGMDHYWEFVRGPITQVTGTKLFSACSSFGILISGANSPNKDSLVSTLLVENPSTDPLKCFWDSETFEASYQTLDNVQEDSVLLDFNNTTRKVKDRYEVRFPWKHEDPPLLSNLKLCKGRFDSLMNKLTKYDLFSRYNKVIRHQLELGFIELVDVNEPTSGILHYIPHHPVINEDRATTKLRIVYDGSARVSPAQPSLNGCLHAGPNLLTDLVRMLIQFRTYAICLLADIEKAFLQVSLAPVDRDSTRFFWLKDITKPATDDNIQVYRFTRVLFGATCSPFLLAATLRFHLGSYEDASIRETVDKFYVDNYCDGANTVFEATRKYTKMKRVLNEAGMNLREWMSNSQDFLASVPANDRASSNVSKFLGVHWETSSDLLYAKNVIETAPNPKFTKRLLLHGISRVYDPLGIVSPIIVRSKMLIQELWKLDLDWDQEVPSSVHDQWIQHSRQLARLSEIKIPRLLPKSPHELHIFVDASKKAYGTVAYLRTETECNFVSSKTRVAPVKEMTIPKLELSACVLGCKFAKFIQETITSIKHVTIWSDSQIVLCWINNPPSKQPVFVKNRIAQILTNNFSFQYCATSENPADLCSRGTSLDELKNSNHWWHGPPWLSLPSDQWPCKSSNVKSSQAEPGVTTIHTLSSSALKPSTPFGIDLLRFNRLDKLLRVTSLCNRFVQRLQRKDFDSSVPSAVEIEQALHLWLASVQKDSFDNELNLLKSRKGNKLIKELQLHLSDGLLHSRGRFAHVKDSLYLKDLVLLPSRHPFTDMLIMHHHNKLQHQGPRHTLTSVRDRYWIPKGRQIVRSVLNKCQICRYWEGPSFRLPLPPPLPASRVTRSPPFTFTGCDFAGPIYVFDNGSPTKSYICLFTCAVTRAVHLELVADMTTTTFILALKRFIHRRGVPVQIISDNAKTFKMAKSVIEELCHNIVISKDCMNIVAHNGIDWRFNIERSPWWGGFFERMVGLVKRTLIKAVGKAKLTSTQLMTSLTEIEAILNTRPLTYVFSDVNDGQPLTPNHFICPTQRTFLPSHVMQPDPDYKESPASILLSLVHTQEKLLDYYWSIWRREYLSILREHHQQSQKGHKDGYQDPTIGDVVLIREEGLKRAHWKTGIIQKVFHNKDDGYIRSAQIQTISSVLNRPITLLYPLEIKTHKDDSPSEPPKVNEAKSKRNSAMKATHAIQRYYKTEDKD